MKGLRVPRLFLWIKGFIRGKIIHTGGLDPGTGTISSGYVTGQTKRFNTACIVRCEQADSKLNRVWNEADQILIDFKQITASSPEKSTNDTVTSPRIAEKSTSLLKRLATIANDIKAEQTLCYDQMATTAEMLLSTFSCYGHGHLMKPVYPSNLPTISYEEYSNQIIEKNKDIQPIL